VVADLLHRVEDVLPGRVLHTGGGLRYAIVETREGGGFHVCEPQRPGAPCLLTRGAVQAILANGGWVALGDFTYATPFGTTIARATAPDMVRALKGLRLLCLSRQRKGESTPRYPWSVEIDRIDAELARLEGGRA